MTAYIRHELHILFFVILGLAFRHRQPLSAASGLRRPLFHARNVFSTKHLTEPRVAQRRPVPLRFPPSLHHELPNLHHELEHDSLSPCFLDRPLHPPEPKAMFWGPHRRGRTCRAVYIWPACHAYPSPRQLLTELVSSLSIQRIRSVREEPCPSSIATGPLTGWRPVARMTPCLSTTTPRERYEGVMHSGHVRPEMCTPCSQLGVKRHLCFLRGDRLGQQTPTNRFHYLEKTNAPRKRKDFWYLLSRADHVAAAASTAHLSKRTLDTNEACPRRRNFFDQATHFFSFCPRLTF